MSNDDRVIRLNERLDVGLVYVDKLDASRTEKPKLNKTRLKELAKKIRKDLEESSFEVTVHPHTTR